MSIDIIKWIKGWRLDKFFKSLKNDIGTIAITLTQAIKTAAEGTVLQTISSFVDELFKTHIAEDALSVVKAAATKALAVELAIQGLPDNPTPEDVQNFENAVYKAITGLDPAGKSKLWTTLAAQIYGIVQPYVGAGDPITFAQIVSIVEQAYQKYLQDTADQSN